jgi:hypothetical protein
MMPLNDLLRKNFTAMQSFLDEMLIIPTSTSTQQIGIIIIIIIIIIIVIIIINILLS